MVKHTQTIRRKKFTNCLSVFDHFVRLALKGLTHRRMQNPMKRLRWSALGKLLAAFRR